MKSMLVEQRMKDIAHRDFWHEVFFWGSAVSPCIARRVMAFGLIATVVWYVGSTASLVGPSEVAPYELIGAALAVLLMLRTNTGYDRWYEGRKLWGGIVNQTRNFAQIALAYGPRDRAWRADVVRWVAAFPHACRHSLRGDKDIDDLRRLAGDDFAELQAAQHLPLFVSLRLSRLLRQAVDDNQLDQFAFMQAETQRALLIDHIGACERILKTPLAKALSVKVRRFLTLYLVALPFGIFDKADALTPLIVMLVSYPLLSLDQISVDLQNPFSVRRLSHLPLDEICANIQDNVTALAELELDDDEAPRRPLVHPMAV